MSERRQGLQDEGTACAKAPRMEKSPEARKRWAEGAVAEDAEEGGGQSLPIRL